MLLRNAERRQSQPKFGNVVLSVSEVVNIIQKAIRLLENTTTLQKIEDIKTVLNRIRKPYYHLVSTTLDDHQLDILHHAIINNCPAIVKYILSETTFFPPTYFPKSNPYAHLAAVLGFTECLQHILEHRPLDYFKTEDPARHRIILPRYLEQRTGLDKIQKSHYVKGTAGLLDKIKSTTTMAEIKRQNGRLPDDTDIAEILSMDDFDEDKKETKRPKPVLLPKKPPTMKLIKSPAMSKPPQQPGIKSQSAFSKRHQKQKVYLNEMEMTKPETFSVEHFKRELKPGTGKHIITVYRDILPDTPEGVLRGVGQKATINFKDRAPTSHIPIIQGPRRSRLPGTMRTTKLSDAFKIEALKKASRDSMVSDGKPDKERKESARSQKPGDAGPISHSPRPPVKNVEIGVRGLKKYKDFHLMLDDTSKVEKEDMKRTPLHFAAEMGHSDCVQLILKTIISKNIPMMISHDPITLATKARSPEAILLLISQKFSLPDYQAAVLVAIREQYPDSLSALLVSKGKERRSLFNGTNLFHVLYSQSLLSHYRYDMMPVMTRVLIERGEDVNSSTSYCSFPMYTLINCAFHVSLGKQIVYYVECFKMLLEAKANPFFNEVDSIKKENRSDATDLGRSPFASAIHCIMESAVNSVNYFENSYWSKLFMKKFILTLVACDKTLRRSHHRALFVYINGVCELGLDGSVIRALLRYGCNPDFMDRRYAVNFYFDKILPYLAKFEVINSYDVYKDQLAKLEIICRHMSPNCLKEAQEIFLDAHLLIAPLQAVPICRYFTYLIRDLVYNPRPLLRLTAQFIWRLLGRNARRVENLPLPAEFCTFILP